MKQPKDILVKRKNYQTYMVVFDEDNNRLSSGTFDSFGRTVISTFVCLFLASMIF